ncbi:MAG: hypothetical protein JWM96_1347 [Alphaproteobacteria bacterium]|nr:hypothetical protein [Alphaproteobacteria bacterium]
MTAQPINPPSASAVYEQAMRERIALGRLYMDYLCHGRTAAPQAILLFRRLLHLDTLLGADERYDQDHLEIVTVREDARFHRPPRTVPSDHDVQPCGLCRKLILDLDQDLVLLPYEGAA